MTRRPQTVHITLTVEVRVPIIVELEPMDNDGVACGWNTGSWCIDSSEVIKLINKDLESRSNEIDEAAHEAAGE